MTQPRPPGLSIDAAGPRGEPGDWSARVLGGVPALVVYLDRDQFVAYVNEPPARWLAIDPAQLAGRPLYELLDPACRAAARESLRDALGGHPATFEGTLCGHPSHRYMHASLQPDLDGDGRVRGVFGVFVDISERHALELRLRESEQRFFGAFQYATTGMALVRPDGRFLKVNQAVCRMLGYSEAEFLTLSIADVTHPDDFASDQARIEDMLAGRSGGYQMEKRNLHKDGRVVYLQLSVSLVRDEHGRPLYFVSQVQDVSQRRQAEEALFRERELAEVTLESIGDAVIAADLDLRITSLNPIAEALTGWPATEARGRPVAEVFRLRSADSGQPLPDPLQQAVERNAIVDLGNGAALLHRNGFVTPVEDSAAPIHDRAGQVIGGVLVFREISETRTLALRMVQLTQLDSLTGLPNRSQLQTQLELAVTAARRHRQRCALLFLDVDHFKRINSQHGPRRADEALRALAAELRGALREDDVLFRHHGDEFVVLMPHLDSPGEAASLAQRLLLRAARVRLPEMPDTTLTLSIGISLFPEDAGEPEALLRHADSAMYEVKVEGRHDYRFFNPRMNERAAERRRIEGALRVAVAREELSLFYQPKVAAHDGRIVGAEALLRWYAGGRERYAPDQFIPVAEDCGLIVPIGSWVLREAVRQVRRWLGELPVVPVAVNVSPLQFLHPGFLDELTAVLAEGGLEPGLIELELTERTVMSGGDSTIALLQRIKQCGVRLALDDFGTGYCSLSYLKHFPVDALKIDRAFVRDIASDHDTAAITQAIIAMARSLGKEVIAEGVETESQAAYLREAGCAQLQGFLYAPPVDAATFAGMLAAQARAG